MTQQPPQLDPVKVELTFRGETVDFGGETLALETTKRVLESMHIGVAKVIHFFGVVAGRPFSGVEGLFFTVDGVREAATTKLQYLIMQKYPGNWKIESDPDTGTYTATQWEDVLNVRILELKTGVIEHGI